ncbi:hypothetical protein [Pseudomonas sp. NA-150]|uniref:hypothetical protein n=1 Tax=Pseudomonas sp. NA-150 TaxID=3367525 RepID=UPI0037C6A433
MSAATLAVLMEAPSSLEEEFNDWYDTEHFPQRIALPGFLKGRRWVCLHSWPRYLAVYDLVDSSALRTCEYLSVSGQHSTPWSRRVLPRTVGRQRLVLESLNDVEESAISESLLFASWSATEGKDIEPLMVAINEVTQRLPGLCSARFFRGATDESNPSRSLYLIATFDHHVDINSLQPLRRPSAIGSTLFNMYIPYNR